MRNSFARHLSAVALCDTARQEVPSARNRWTKVHIFLTIADITLPKRGGTREIVHPGDREYSKGDRYTLLNDMYDRGLLTDRYMMEIPSSHTNVVFRPPVAFGISRERCLVIFSQKTNV
jgi:hypothetical protein